MKHSGIGEFGKERRRVFKSKAQDQDSTRPGHAGARDLHEAMGQAKRRKERKVWMPDEKG